jgi:hypothetical protein
MSELIDGLKDPIASEDLEFEGLDGMRHVLTLVLGRPFQTSTGVWRCSFSHGVDGVMTQDSRGGPGRVSAVINAALTLAAAQERVLVSQANHSPR